MISFHTKQLAAASLFALGFLGWATGTVAAQESGEAALLDVTGWAAVATLLAGTVMLLASVELLIHALVRTASRVGISTFVLAVVISGWEFDNVAFGLFTGFAEMQDVAFGLAIGNAISIFGLTLAIGAIAFPFVIDVPRDYLVLTVLAPLIVVPVLLTGTLTLPFSLAFLAAYVAIFAYILRREGSLDRAFVQSDEVREVAATPDGTSAGHTRSYPWMSRFTRHGWFWPAMLVVALAGIVLGAKVSSAGTEGVLETWQLTGTFVGITIVTILYTLDDLLLIIEPLRLGYNDVAVGGLIGSLLFFVTANIGIVGLVGNLTFRPETIYFHLPALLLFSGLSSYFLWRGEVRRHHGLMLFVLYVGYLLLNLQFFSALPVEG